MKHIDCVKKTTIINQVTGTASKNVMRWRFDDPADSFFCQNKRNISRKKMISWDRFDKNCDSLRLLFKGTELFFAKLFLLSIDLTAAGIGEPMTSQSLSNSCQPPRLNNLAIYLLKRLCLDVISSLSHSLECKIILFNVS